MGNFFQKYWVHLLGFFLTIFLSLSGVIYAQQNATDERHDAKLTELDTSKMSKEEFANWLIEREKNINANQKRLEERIDAQEELLDERELRYQQQYEQQQKQNDRIIETLDKLNDKL